MARARDLDDVTVGRDSAYVAEYTYELDHRRFATHGPMSRRPTYGIDAISRDLGRFWCHPTRAAAADSCHATAAIPPRFGLISPGS